MKAARFHGATEGLRIEDVPRPEVGPDELLVRVAGAGICHSDLHILHGDLPLPNPPTTLGHENAGYIEEMGEDVDAAGVEEGTPVAVYGAWGCGNCRVCKRGEEQLCNVINWVGVGYDGGYADYLRVPTPRYLVPLDDLDPRDAAPLTDAGLTAYRAVRKAETHLQPSQPLVVVGVGGLGQYAVQFADKLTGSTVVAVDVQEHKLDHAESLGADVTVNTEERRLSEALRGRRGAGAVLDFVGTDETLQAGVNALGKQGTLYLIGIGGGSYPFSWNPLEAAELTLSTVYWGSLDELHEVIGIAESGELDIQTETVGFDELHRTFERLEDGEVEGRAVLYPRK